MLRLRNEDLKWRAVESEIIILDRRTWAYISVNDSGAVLWHHMVEGATRADLVAALRGAYDLDEQRAEADVERFLDMLREHDLIEGETAS